MAIRRVITLLTGGADDTPLLNQALVFCAKAGAKLDAVFVRRNAASGSDFLGETFSVYGMEALLETLDEAAGDAAMRAKNAFEAATDAVQPAAAGRFIEYLGLPRAALAEEGRLSDLIWALKPEEGGPPSRLDIVEIAARQSGRPVLAAPASRDPHTPLERIMVAWDGSLHGARALHGALPVLRQARHVTLVHAGADAHSAAQLASLAEFLDRHEVRAGSETLTLDGLSEAAALAGEAVKLEADLVVMGGFGASGLRSLGGGDTPAVLRAVACPVLLAN